MNPANKITALRTLGFFLWVLWGPVAAQPFHVNGTCGNDAWNGTSETCSSPNGPKATIQAGIRRASTGDTVIVADGTYYITESDPYDAYGTRRLSFSSDLEPISKLP